LDLSKVKFSFVLQTVSETAIQRTEIFSGSLEPFAYLSSTTQFQLAFTSGSRITKRGFTANFYISDKGKL